ncbi:hypothetical protein, partial [Endozoicomonas atrinae]|uniref:hypothetical protein n=1 Tax=Endozoicomonas atrinae TaxID=1333660 RepID=UPI001EE6EFF8
RVSLVKYLTFWNYQTCRPPQKAILNDRSFWTGVLRTFYAGDDNILQHWAKPFISPGSIQQELYNFTFL